MMTLDLMAQPKALSTHRPTSIQKLGAGTHCTTCASELNCGGELEMGEKDVRICCVQSLLLSAIVPLIHLSAASSRHHVGFFSFSLYRLDLFPVRPFRIYCRDQKRAERKESKNGAASLDLRLFHHFDFSLRLLCSHRRVSSHQGNFEVWNRLYSENRYTHTAHTKNK